LRAAGAFLETQTLAFFEKAGVEVNFVPFDPGAEIKAAKLGGHITGANSETENNADSSTYPGVALDKSAEASCSPCLMFVSQRALWIQLQAWIISGFISGWSRSFPPGPGSGM
jgi:hypothetical protein